MQLESNLKNAYSEAYRIACEALAQCDIEEVCRNSKAVYEKETHSLIIKYFGTEYQVHCSSGAVALKNTADEPTTTEKVLILHYLIHAKPKPLTGRNISFMEVAGGGAIYYSTFKKRAIDPLVKIYGDHLQGFKNAAAALFGVPERLGSISATLYAFPLVPITYVLWQGDDEVASSGNILFDASVSCFLPVEDVVLAASFGAYRLIGQKG